MNLPTLSRNDIFNWIASIKFSSHQRNARSDKVNLERVYGMCRRKRRGAAAVEFAIVAPIFFLLVLGMIEYGRIIMVQQVITNASREGARFGVLDGTSTTAVGTLVTNYLSAAKISGQTTKVYVNNVEAEPSTATYGQPIKVTITVPFSKISWLPNSWFGNSGMTLQASTIMRRETVQQ